MHDALLSPVLMAEGQASDDSEGVGGVDHDGLAEAAPALGTFPCQEVAPACPGPHDFAGAGDLKPLGHGLVCLNTFGASHIMIWFPKKERAVYEVLPDEASGFFIGLNRFALQFPHGCLKLRPMTEPLALVSHKRLLPGTQLGQRLRDMGYRVRVLDGSEGLAEVAARERALLVIVDLGGAEDAMCKAISQLVADEKTSHLPVIAIHKDKDAKSAQSARAAGAKVVVNELAILAHLDQFLEQALAVE